MQRHPDDDEPEARHRPPSASRHRSESGAAHYLMPVIRPFDALHPRGASAPGPASEFSAANTTPTGELVATDRRWTLLARDLEVALGTTARGVLEQQGITDDLEAFKRLAQASGMSAAVEKYGALAYKTMALHLLAAVSHLEEALKALMTGFTSRDKSWLELLRELGLDIDVGDAKRLFDEEMERLEIMRAGAK